MKRVQIDTFLQYQFLSDPAFSPDGERIAFLVRRANEKQNGYRCDLWLYETASGSCRPLTRDGGVRHFAWTPEGALLTARSAPLMRHGTAVSLLFPRGEERPAFTLPMETLQFFPLSDGRTVVLAKYRIPQRANDEGAAYDAFEELPFRWNGQGLVNGVRNRLYLCARDGALLPITGEDFFVGNFSTSPWRLSTDGETILFLGQKVDSGVQKQYPGLYAYSISTQKNRCLVPEGTLKVEVAQLLDCRSAIVTATDGARYGANQMPEFHLLDLASGSLSPLRQYELSIGASITTDSALGGGITNKVQDGVLYFITMEGGASYLRSIDGAGNLSPFLTPTGSCAAFDVWGGRRVTLGMYQNGLRELYLDGKQITFFNRALLEEYDLSTPRPLASRRPGGEKVEGWVMFPVGYEEGKRYPAILNIHGGPRAAFGPTFFHEMQVWAGAGYFVLFCNPHGSDGRGNAFGDMRGIYGTIDYEDLMAFTDAALTACSAIDETRLGVTGGSYGGYMTNWIIGHTNRFRCAASQRSISDWAMSEFISDCGYQRNAAKMGASALEDFETVWSRSPLRYAEKVLTPTLFLHSYEDFRCHHSQAVAMYTAVRQRGVTARLCLFKGENHELSRSGKPKNRISRMKEILSWMDRFLK